MKSETVEEVKGMTDDGRERKKRKEKKGKIYE